MKILLLQHLSMVSTMRVDSVKSELARVTCWSIGHVCNLSSPVFALYSHKPCSLDCFPITHSLDITTTRLTFDDRDPTTCSGKCGTLYVVRPEEFERLYFCMPTWLSNIVYQIPMALFIPVGTSPTSSPSHTLSSHPTHHRESVNDGSRSHILPFYAFSYQASPSSL